MKLLLLADLHGRADWFAWAARQRCDALLIAGDLLDAFAKSGLLPQMLALAAWCGGLKTPSALSSGNHDSNEPGDRSWLRNGPPKTLTPEDAALLERFQSSERWMDALDRPGLVPDNRSALLQTRAGSLVVTTVPYDPAASDGRDSLWLEGARLRREHHVPWFVLHHEPPADTAVGGMMGDVSLARRIRQHRPDFVLSGHLHDQPYQETFADRFEGAWCFNPGAPPPSKLKAARQPNAILLDLKMRAATWTATPKRGKTLISRTIPLRQSQSGL